MIAKILEAAVGISFQCLLYVFRFCDWHDQLLNASYLTEKICPLPIGGAIAEASISPENLCLPQERVQNQSDAPTRPML